MAGVSNSREEEAVEAATPEETRRVIDLAQELGRGPITRSILASHPRGVGLVFATYELESLVWTGGLWKYLFYTMAENIDLAVEGYDEFPCPLHAAWVRQARDLFASEFGELWGRRSVDFGAVKEVISRIADAGRLKPLDRRFFDVEEAENTWRLRDAAMSAQPSLYRPHRS